MMSEVVCDGYSLGIPEIFFLDPRIEGRGVSKPLHQILHTFLAPTFFQCDPNSKHVIIFIDFLQFVFIEGAN